MEMHRRMGVAIAAVFAAALLCAVAPQPVAGYEFRYMELVSINIGTNYTDEGTLSYQEYEVYEMPLSKGMKVNLAIETNLGANFNFLLFNETEEQIQSGMAFPGGKEMDFTAEYTGNYYVIVEYLQGSNWYVFTAVCYGYDFSDAEPIAVPGSDTGSLSLFEKHAYILTLTAGVQATFNLQGPSRSNFNLYLFNAQEAEVSSSLSSSSNEILNYNPLLGGTYYVIVDVVRGSGAYTLTISIPGGSTSFEKATPDDVPWSAGDALACGGYIGLSEMLDDAGEALADSLPDRANVTLDGLGGMGEYMMMEYVGEENGLYEFEYWCREYVEAEATWNVEADGAFFDGESLTGTMSGRSSASIDASVEGSIWLAYYENLVKTNAYWAAEKMTLKVAGTVDMAAHADVNVRFDGEDINGTADSTITGDAEVDLTIESQPGMPFMPAKDAGLQISSQCAVAYSGSVSMSLAGTHNATGTFGDYLDDIGEGEPETIDVDESANAAIVATFSLAYDNETGEASAPPLVHGGWAMLLRMGYGLPWNLQWSSFACGATFDPEDAMYSAYEPYWGPLGSELGLTVPFVGGLQGTSMLDGLTIDSVPTTEAESFNSDPAAFLASKGIEIPSEDEAPFPWFWVGVAVAIIVIVIVVALVVYFANEGAFIDVKLPKLPGKRGVSKQPRPYVEPQQPPQYHYEEYPSDQQGRPPSQEPPKSP